MDHVVPVVELPVLTDDVLVAPGVELGPSRDEPGMGVRIMNWIESMSFFSANSAVASIVSTSSSSEPTTNMPWIRICRGLEPLDGPLDLAQVLLLLE
jgi:hypothetical protein